MVKPWSWLPANARHDRSVAKPGSLGQRKQLLARDQVNKLGEVYMPFMMSQRAVSVPFHVFFCKVNQGKHEQFFFSGKKDYCK